MPFERNGFDAGHTNVLDNPEVREVFLAKCHPEPGPFERRKILYQRFQFFVVNQVRFFWANIRIIEWFVYFVGFGQFPFPVLPVFPFLCYLPDVDLGIEIGGKCLAVVARVAINNVEVMNFVEMVFCRVSRINAGNTGVETATQNGRNTGFLKSVAVGPLPFVLEFGFVFGLVIGRVEVSRFGF